MVASQQLRLLPMSSSRALTLPQKSLFLNLSPHNSPCHRPATTRVFSRSQVPKRAFSHLTKFSSHHKGDTQPHRGLNLNSNKHGQPHSHRWTTSRETTTTHSSRTNTKVATATKVVCMVAIIKATINDLSRWECRGSNHAARLYRHKTRQRVATRRR